MTLEQHLRSRHLDLELHCPVLDEAEMTATFWLWNLSGQLVGYQQYKPLKNKEKNNHPKECRYFTFRKAPTVAVWGVESLDLTPNLVFVTEGVFDAARLTERGVSALAVLSNNPGTDVKNWLSMLNRRVVCVCDNDAAGRKLAALGHEAVFCQDKDLGDSDDEFVDALVDRFLKR